ncbi:MAG: hypothetical protein Athens071426_661 [Parcubacteria group bacterium Athens0714_26]|nr:MAG: hypothetical protein Athens101426_480 [Parcubacteria group bacterium Athens1014_26]TSD01540.1 MAG: hypothetical protein Athens071426_661 [Parcubacteria group bacterium Athens0714_26]
MKRVFIIHGWGGYPKEGWFPWLKKELQKKDFKVFVPQMPNAEYPKITAWVKKLKQEVGKVDKDTYFVGHSIGCQTILRYLEFLKTGEKIGGVVFVAGWVNLNIKAIEEEQEGSSKIVMPWIKSSIKWGEVKKRINKIIMIFSTNDPVVPLGDVKVFKKKLKPKIIICKNKGHFIGSDGVVKLPVVLESVLEISK